MMLWTRSVEIGLARSLQDHLVSFGEYSPQSFSPHRSSALTHQTMNLMRLFVRDY
jgi:hypothetical protein